ncbi:MAG: sugar phosphate isomerase/epimerase family protein, partial [Thermoguttaceae bacterium]
MGKVSIGLNLEAIRTSHKSFEWGVEFAKQLGYEYIEPMVHWGRELLSEARYFHSVSMLDDPLRIKTCCDKFGIKVSAFS